LLLANGPNRKGKQKKAKIITSKSSHEVDNVKAQSLFGKKNTTSRPIKYRLKGQLKLTN